MHSVLRRDDLAIIVFSDNAGYERPGRTGEAVGHGTYVSVDGEPAVDAVHATAGAAVI